MYTALIVLSLLLLVLIGAYGDKLSEIPLIRQWFYVCLLLAMFVLTLATQ